MVTVTVLGSGDAFCSGGRNHAAYLVQAPGRTFLLDCGATILHTLKRGGHDPAAIDFVVLSHLHGDHFAGVPFLFLDYRYESRRRRPFTVYGPPETPRRVEQLFEALYASTACEASPFGVEYRELAPGVPASADGVEIVPMRVKHAEELVCLAFRITVAGKTIVYSGDCAWTDELVTLSQGADLFICECTYFETRFDFHVSYPQIAERASALGCKRLVLSHLGSEPLRRKSEISLECAEDGMVIRL